MTLNSAIKSGKRLGIACSGGADSVFLVLLIYSEFIHLRQSLNLCHFNHKLRGRESNLDERYVKELSKYLKIPFHRGTALTHGKSDEGTLRNLRLNFFRDKEHNWDSHFWQWAIMLMMWQRRYCGDCLEQVLFRD